MTIIMKHIDGNARLGQLIPWREADTINMASVVRTLSPIDYQGIAEHTVETVKEFLDKTNECDMHPWWFKGYWDTWVVISTQYRDYQSPGLLFKQLTEELRDYSSEHIAMLAMIVLIERMNGYEDFVDSLDSVSEAVEVVERELRLNHDACLLGMALIHLNAQRERIKVKSYAS